MTVRTLLVVGLLVAGCSADQKPSPNAANAGPRFIAAAPAGTIVFSSTRHSLRVASADQSELADFELYVVKPDGTGVKQITKSPGAVIAPRWSPDGNNLAFIWTLDGTDSQLWVASADGMKLSMLVDLEGLAFAGLNWSPDGAYLAYTDDDSIRILDVAGGSDRRLVKGSWPSWASVGGSTVLVYTSGAFVGEGSKTDLRVIDPDGANNRPILFGSDGTPSGLTNASEASAEPESGRIAFVTSANGYRGEPSEWNEQIYVAELIDGDPVRTTAPLLVSRSARNDHWPPGWSRRSASASDAACVVWTVDGEKSGRGHLVSRSIGSTETEIVDLTRSAAGYDLFPDWHPDAACVIQ